MRAQEYLDSLPGSEQRGVNKFLKGLGETSCPISVIETHLVKFSPSEWASVYFQGIRWNSSPRNDAVSEDAKVGRSKMFPVKIRWWRGGPGMWRKESCARACVGSGQEHPWSRLDTHFVKMGGRSHCRAFTVVKGSLCLGQNALQRKFWQSSIRIPQILMFCILVYSTNMQMTPRMATINLSIPCIFYRSYYKYSSTTSSPAGGFSPNLYGHRT